MTISTFAVGDRRPATAGELSFVVVVVDCASNTTRDQRSTETPGRLALAVQIGAPFYVYRRSDPLDVYGSADFMLVGSDTESG